MRKNVNKLAVKKLPQLKLVSHYNDFPVVYDMWNDCVSVSKNCSDITLNTIMGLCSSTSKYNRVHRTLDKPSQNDFRLRTYSASFCQEQVHSLIASFSIIWYLRSLGKARLKSIQDLIGFWIEEYEYKARQPIELDYDRIRKIAIFYIPEPRIPEFNKAHNAVLKAVMGKHFKDS